MNSKNIEKDIDYNYNAFKTALEQMNKDEITIEKGKAITSLLKQGNVSLSMKIELEKLDMKRACNEK